MSKGSRLEIGSDHGERALYIVSGSLEIEGTIFDHGKMLILKDGLDIEILSDTECRVMLLGGATMDGARHVWWNFVSSSRERIEQAKKDWKEGRFAKVPGDSEEYIPLPDS
jgi:redox-sensitive bicupin YhaK (pirin superfamily)